MKGLSGKLNGYILDNPDRDPNVPILHHVYCTHKKCIFILTKDAYDENVRQLDQNRKNDHHRIEDAAPKIGDYIVFTIEKNQKYGHVILDFEKAENPMDLEFDNGTNVFKSLCVFNGDLNKVYSEHFGEFEVNMDALKVCLEVDFLYHLFRH
jgi:imidazoleglycerol phosphate dehydratase HisB